MPASSTRRPASGLFGNAGQTNYAAAKAGIAAFTNVCALELGRLGVTANCLAPVAVTRLVAPLMGGEESIPDEIKEAIGPRWIAAVATWLASPEARGVTGRTFEVRGDKVSVAEGWHGGPAGQNSGEPGRGRQGHPGASSPRPAPTPTSRARTTRPASPCPRGGYVCLTRGIL